MRRSTIGCGIWKHQDHHLKNQVCMMLQEVLMDIGMHIGENNADNKCKSVCNCSTIDEPTLTNSKNPRSYPRSEQIGAFCFWSIRRWARSSGFGKKDSFFSDVLTNSQRNRQTFVSQSRKIFLARHDESEVTSHRDLKRSWHATRDTRQQTWPQLSDIVNRDNWCTKCIIWTCR